MTGRQLFNHRLLNQPTVLCITNRKQVFDHFIRELADNNQVEKFELNRGQAILTTGERLIFTPDADRCRGRSRETTEYFLLHCDSSFRELDYLLDTCHAYGFTEWLD